MRGILRLVLICVGLVELLLENFKFENLHIICNFLRNFFDMLNYWRLVVHEPSVIAVFFLEMSIEFYFSLNYFYEKNY